MSKARRQHRIAGLLEEHAHTTGSDKMLELAGSAGLQFLVHHFDSLKAIVVAGEAKAMLPCCLVADRDQLNMLGDVVLNQPLWMLYHEQDRDVPHLKSAREWIREAGRTRLGLEPPSPNRGVPTR